MPRFILGAQESTRISPPSSFRIRMKPLRGVFFIAHFLISVVCPALMSARFRSPCSVSSYPVFKNPCHLTLHSELKFKATHKLVQPRHVIPETETEEKEGECPTVPHKSRELSPSWLLKWMSSGKQILSGEVTVVTVIKPVMMPGTSHPSLKEPEVQWKSVMGTCNPGT